MISDATEDIEGFSGLEGHVECFGGESWGGIWVQDEEKYGDGSWADDDHRDAVLGLRAGTELNRNVKHDNLEEKDKQTVITLWPRNGIEWYGESWTSAPSGSDRVGVKA